MHLHQKYWTYMSFSHLLEILRTLTPKYRCLGPIETQLHLCKKKKKIIKLFWCEWS